MADIRKCSTEFLKKLMKAKQEGKIADESVFTIEEIKAELQKRTLKGM